MKKNIKNIGYGLLLAGSAAVIGCQDGAVPLQFIKGVAYHSSGINYSTATTSGTTDASGSFDYQEGEAVTFSIGDIVLGTVIGSASVTPMELADSSLVNNQQVINIARFLEALDRTVGDKIIVVDALAHSCASGVSINFDQDPETFEFADAAVEAYLNCADGALSDIPTAIDNLETELGERSHGKIISKLLDDGTTSAIQDLINGAGFRSAELIGECHEMGAPIFGGRDHFESLICFRTDGSSGEANFMGFDFEFEWSVDIDAGLLISISSLLGDMTIHLQRLEDGSILFDTSGFPEIPGLPTGFGDMSLISEWFPRP